MAQKKADPLGLAIVAAILARRSEFPSSLAAAAEAVGPRWEVCEAVLGKASPEHLQSKSINKLLDWKSKKPASFDTVVRGVIGGEIVIIG